MRAEFYIQNDDSKSYFELLKAEKDKIEAEFGEPLNWYSHEDVKSCRIYAERGAEVENRDVWPELFEWLKLNLEKFDQVFRDRVKSLSLEDARPGGPE